MNIQPRTLTTPELISQQALEINRLNYAIGRFSDDHAQTWHPEFGSIWRYIEVIGNLMKMVTKLDTLYMVNCYHKDRYEHDDCLSCEIARLINDAKICIDNVTSTKVERINDATSRTNP